MNTVKVIMPDGRTVEREAYVDYECDALGALRGIGAGRLKPQDIPGHEILETVDGKFVAIVTPR